MADATSTKQDSAATDEQQKNLDDQQAPQDTDDTTDGADVDLEGADQLGDPGKKALDAMKGKWRSEREKRQAVEAELEELRKAASKKPDDEQPSAEEIRREAEKAATQKANARIVRSEIRAAAAGKLADPKDALTFLNPDDFEVDENGEVDTEEVADAIDDLLTKKPYLAATAKRFQGTADNGAAGRNAGKPKQLTREDLDGMKPDEIVKAKAEGRLNELLGIK